MIRFLLLAYFTFFAQITIHAQMPISAENQKFEDYCKKIRQYKSDFTNQKLLSISDSLYSVAKNNYQKVNALVVQVDAYSSNNQNNIALQKVKIAEKIAKKEGYLDKEIYLKALTASIYRLVDYNYSAISILKRAEELNDENKNNPKYVDHRIKILVELADNYSFTQDYSNAKKCLNEVIELIEQRDPENFHYIDALIILGDLHNKTYQFNETFKIVEKIKKHNEKFKNTHVNLLVEFMCAEAFFTKGDYQKSLDRIKVAEKIINDNSYENDRYVVLKLRADIYIKLNDTVSFNKTVKELQKINEKNALNKTEFMDEVTVAEDTLFSKIKEWLYVLYIMAFVLIAFIIILLIYIKNSQKKQKKAFNQFIDNYKTELNQSQEIEVKLPTPTLTLSENTEFVILTKLENFEHEHGYVNNKLTIAGLAVLLETNTKYLTLILKKYRNQNFKDYLNSKRIEYITKRLIEEPELLRYKINHLADISGFSSHSHFASVFKKHTNLSPSDFIRELQQKISEK